MATVLLAYGTTEGQTRKIAEFIAAELRDDGHAVELVEIESAPPAGSDPRPDAVLLAASVHVGRHSDAVSRFVQERREWLDAVPAAFLSVSLAAGREETRAEAAGYAAAFHAETGWRPALSGTVGGALRYSQYGLFKRLLMKWIAWRGGLPTDSSRDHEFTDWEEVRRFAAAFLRSVERAPAETPRG